MSRQIPKELVQSFIKLDDKIEALKQEREDQKKRLRSYHDKGYESSLLIFRESSSWKPDWKGEVERLTKKFMTPTKRRVYFSRLVKRFPRKVIAVAVLIASKMKNHSSDDGS
jgi:hypothetical protein